MLVTMSASDFSAGRVMKINVFARKRLYNCIVLSVQERIQPLTPRLYVDIVVEDCGRKEQARTLSSMMCCKYHEYIYIQKMIKFNIRLRPMLSVHVEIFHQKTGHLSKHRIQ